MKRLYTDNNDLAIDGQTKPSVCGKLPNDDVILVDSVWVICKKLPSGISHRYHVGSLYGWDCSRVWKFFILVTVIEPIPKS